MMEFLFGILKGYFIFHTETSSTYKAHEKLGFKRLFEVPYPDIENCSWGASTSYIMYGRKSDLKLAKA